MIEDELYIYQLCADLFVKCELILTHFLPMGVLNVTRTAVYVFILHD